MRVVTRTRTAAAAVCAAVVVAVTGAGSAETLVERGPIWSKNRHGRFRESDLLRKVFETTVRRSMAEGLVGGEGFAVDPV